MYNIYVGIDLSKNSTGIYIEVDDYTYNKIDECFYIIKPGKLTKKEKQAELDNIKTFNYILYDKLEQNEINYKNEYNKTINFLSITNIIKELLFKYNNKYQNNNIYICLEGISYGSSIRTKSVFDLAGLNYMVRTMILQLNLNTFLYIGAPKEIKKFTTGNGNANKQLMLSKFNETFPNIKLPKTDDICDAYFMAIYIKNIKNNEK